MENRLWIPEFNLGGLKYKIEALNRKASKLNCESVSLKVLASKIHTYSDEITGHKRERSMVEVEITGISPKLPGGWKFCGTLEHTEGGNIVRSVPGVELPETYRKVEAKCDHCQKIRRRNDTYIVQNEAGEFKQVGHNCVHDFLGHVDPKWLLVLAQIIHEVRGSENDDYMGGCGFGRRIFTAHTLSFLGYAAECILKFGWVSRSYAKDAIGTLATADQAWKYMHPTPEMRSKGDTLTVSEHAKELAKASLAWVETLKNKASLSDYENNLVVACSQEWIVSRDSGIVASAVSGYQRFMAGEERKAQAESNRKSQAEKSGWFGTPEKREVFILTVMGQHNFDTQFGAMHLFRMQDKDGNIAIWKTHSVPVYYSRYSGTLSITPDEQVGLKMEVGKTYEIKATVKTHSTWKEIKQTVLTRCTVIGEIK